MKTLSSGFYTKVFNFLIQNQLGNSIPLMKLFKSQINNKKRKRATMIK